MTLEDLGWNARFANEFRPYRHSGWQPARLIRDNKITYGALFSGGDELEVTMGGKVYHDAATDAELPAVGDWVAVEVCSQGGEPMIRARLSRQTCLSRKMSGRSTEEQVIAANVDVVVVVTECGPDFSVRRLERYFAIIGKSGARAVVLVNKADLYEEAKNAAAAAAVKALSPAAQVILASAESGRGMEELRACLTKGVTLTLVGSSGVGKSSVMNNLLGEDYQWTDAVNLNTGKGRHSTTARELIVLPGGGILIDNPGIREVHMWTDERTLRERFADLEELAAACKYQDCKHGTDAGCAIRAAMAAGKLDGARFEGFMKLEKELETLRLSRRKREMTGERHARRNQERKDRRYVDRSVPGHEHEPRRRRG